MNFFRSIVQKKPDLKAVPDRAPEVEPVLFRLTREEQLELENLSLKKRMLLVQARELDFHFETVKRAIRERSGISRTAAMTFTDDFSQATVVPVKKGGTR